MKIFILSLVLVFTSNCNKSDDGNDFGSQTITTVLVGKGHLNNNAIYNMDIPFQTVPPIPV